MPSNNLLPFYLSTSDDVAAQPCHCRASNHRSPALRRRLAEYLGLFVLNAGRQEARSALESPTYSTRSCCGRWSLMQLNEAWEKKYIDETHGDGWRLSVKVGRHASKSRNTALSSIGIVIRPQGAAFGRQMLCQVLRRNWQLLAGTMLRLLSHQKGGEAH
ncbi:hypothetical protein IWZ03DRAFT_171583 [Phyllosticta citriasiana]|uniref:Uncharacterized protein n=1 Tax=Phyllosticta citriasiana TaxID=595635 RepID=A0ABR1KNY4_9PEZI